MAADDIDLNADTGDIVTTFNAKPDVYRMRAYWSVGARFIEWSHTSIDLVGTYNTSGAPPVQLSDIRLRRKVLNVTQET